MVRVLHCKVAFIVCSCFAGLIAFVKSLFLSQYIQVERQQISITCVYPRKELGFDLDDTNLDQHGLVPSGVILARSKTVSIYIMYITYTCTVVASIPIVYDCFLMTNKHC